MKNISRRDFLKGAAAGAGMLAAAALTGCSADNECPTNEIATGEVNNSCENSNWLGVEPIINDIAETKSTDLLIIGAGNGGLMAAVTAADANINFMLCEQSVVLGDTRHWIGAVNTKAMKNAGVKVSEKRILNELARYASYKVNMDLIKMWIDESAEMLDYLESLGITNTINLEAGNHVGGEDMQYYVPSIWHTLSCEGSEFNTMFGFERNKFLEQYIISKGYKVDYEMTLIKLIKDGSKVTGAIFTNGEGKNVQINANNVILATGGYPGNPEMVEQLAPICTRTVTACSYYPLDKGQGIKAAVWAGADMDEDAAPMIFDRGIVAPGVKAGYIDVNGSKQFPGTVSQFMLGTQPFLKVNKDGKRFANESCPYDFFNYAASYQKDGVYAMIVDSNVEHDIIENQQYGCASIATLMALGGAMVPSFEEHINAGLMFKCDTLEELANKLEIPAANLIETVNHYNELCEKGDDVDYGKEAYRMHKVAQAPFYGCYFGGSLLTTCDGIKINKDCQVLDRNCDVIEGLYAVGDCSGSFFSGNYPEYFVGVAVGRTMTQGRHVVRKLAGQI